jgi:hypothetical protein
MALVVPNESEIRLLEYMLNATPSTDQVLHLFRNDVTPSESTTIGDLAEVTAAGYSALTLTPTEWTITTDGDGAAYAQQPTKEFTLSAAETIYGYYVTNAANTMLLWLQRAEFAPAAFGGAGGVFSIKPIFKGRSTN